MLLHYFDKNTMFINKECKTFSFIMKYYSLACNKQKSVTKKVHCGMQ